MPNSKAPLRAAQEWQWEATFRPERDPLEANFCRILGNMIPGSDGQRVGHLLLGRRPAQPLIQLVEGIVYFAGPIMDQAWHPVHASQFVENGTSNAEAGKGPEGSATLSGPGHKSCDVS